MAFFWKTMLVVIYAKTLHRSFIPTIYKDFKLVYFTYIVQIKIFTLVYRFDLSNWKN